MYVCMYVMANLLLCMGNKPGLKSTNLEHQSTVHMQNFIYISREPVCAGPGGNQSSVVGVTSQLEPSKQQ